MRFLTKHAIPGVLKTNRVKWLADYKAAPESKTKRYRYRDPVIKTALKDETGSKCVYCESKIGHNTPGDVEHKIPSSKNINLHFRWTNLTIACTECNRRKNDYYKRGSEFLDPYHDPVEDYVNHFGPVVYWSPGNRRAEITVRTLKLNDSNRADLIFYKMGKIEEVHNLLERYNSEKDVTLKEVLSLQLVSMMDKKSEFSGMVIEILRKNGFVHA